MNLLYTWERYFLKRWLEVFLLFLGCFFGLYVIIDYATHMGALLRHSQEMGWKEVITYYATVFAARSEILIPLALLVALVQTTTSLNVCNELTALMAGGISAQRLMRPFILVGFFFVLLMYAGEQFIQPGAHLRIKQVEHQTKHKRGRSNAPLSVKHVVLEDGSLFLYQDFDLSKQQFFDAYWIPSVDSIYRMKYLSPGDGTPTGYLVDHLTRQKGAGLLQRASYKEIALPEMRFSKKTLQSSILDPETLPLTELASKFEAIPNEANDKESEIAATFTWKLTIPWLCLLAVLAPIPSCIRFSRHFPVFLPMACSLFGLIAFYLFLDAMQVVAKKQLLSPLIAICAPFCLAFGIAIRRFVKLSEL